MPVDPKHVEQILRRIIELGSEEREAAISRECGDDSDLRHEVTARLKAHLQNADKPNAPDPRIPMTLDSSPLLEQTMDSKAGTTDLTSEYQLAIKPGLEIAGRYILEQKIGEGGMGEVWIASQTQPVKRRVALKLIKTGMDSKAVLGRFEQERQALALMDHPNIARVLDGGLTPSGQPFFAMELIKGAPVTKFCDEAKLSPRERLNLFVPICNAIQHAHQKGIVHRDLKPANILVSMVDGKPVPKVIDFGVAKATGGKLTDQTLSTQFGAVVGTLEYMSPEQADFTAVDVDTRSDIYSLGVILYELLTGLRPIDATRLKQVAFAEMVRIIQEEEPSKPSTRLSTEEGLPTLAAVRKTEPRKLTALLRGELDWIVLKCLEKSRERRYETANGLSRDIQRYLVDEPVEARPPTTRYRMGKFLRRNKGLVVATSVVALALLAGVVGTSLGMFEAKRQRLIAEEKAEAAEEARQMAEAAKLEEQTQRKLAEQANRQAVQALDAFTSDLMETLLGSKTQITETEKAVLQNALEQWEVFAQSRGSSIEAQEIRAQGSANVSKIQYKLGLIKKAIQSDRRTLEIWSGLANQFPHTESYRKRLANSYQDLGATLRSAGQRQEAGECFSQAVDVLRLLATDFPENLDYQQSLSESLISVGNFQRDLGNWESSRDNYLEALGLQEQLVEREPDSEDFRESLARGHWGLAFLFKRQKKTAESSGHYKNAIATYELLARNNPDSLNFRQLTGTLYREHGVLLSENEKDQDAVKELEKSLQIHDKIVDEFPSVPQYSFDRFRTQRDLANALYYLGETEKSAAQFLEAIERQTRLVEDHDSVLPYQFELAIANRMLGDLRRDEDRVNSALQAYGKSIEILSSVHAQDRHYYSARAALGRSLEHRAETLDILQRHQEALNDWARVLDLCSEEDKTVHRYQQTDSLLRSGAYESAIVQLDELAAIENSNPNHWFRFAKLYALASENLPERSEELASRSIELLQKATQLGFKDIETIRNDEDLNSLDEREDYQELIKSISNAELN